MEKRSRWRKYELREPCEVDETMRRVSWRVRWRSSARGRGRQSIILSTLVMDSLDERVSRRVRSMAETRSCEHTANQLVDSPRAALQLTVNIESLRSKLPASSVMIW